ncbi:MAG: hypothetical protein A2X36_16820 [Elusimicrobia bacterium GWA2_69_24]|nr:MAG: hypothetical protein A2X36_16820 [Elusimicrobia bacterium GWA2_69_24]HBL16622.1 hydrolase [Elusimicrobiota bacterium]
MRYETLLQRDRAVLIVIDIQEKLVGVYEPAVRERVLGGARRLIAGAQALGLPLIVTEQNPAAIGATHPVLRSALGAGALPVVKTSFSNCGEPKFLSALEATGRRQALLCGIESHVCVLQTALDLAAAGYQVHLCADAAGSRKEVDHAAALARLRQAGVVITTVETALFELLERCTDPCFRAVLKIVK